VTNTFKQTLSRIGAFLDLFWRAARWRALVFAGLILVVGLMPSGAILATGALVSAVPAAAEQGLGSSGGAAALYALAALVVCLATAAVAGNALTQQCGVIDAALGLEVHERVARVALGRPVVATLDNAAFADRVQAIQEADRRGVLRRTALAISGVATTRLRGVAAFGILLAFNWWVPLLLAAAWHVTNRVFLNVAAKGVSTMNQGASRLRRAEYLRSLLIDAPAAKEIRIFGLGGWLAGQYHNATYEVLAATWRARRANRALTVSAVVALVVAHTAALAALAMAASRGQIEVAALLVFVQAVLATSDLGMIGDAQLGLAQSKGVVDRLVGMGPLPATLSTVTPLQRKGPVAVRLENMSFTYPGRARPTLHGLTLDVPPRQSLAIVGQNGAGKSTLIKLLTGLYEPDAGRISIDGAASPLEARGRVAVIFQDFVRYGLSLRENVGFGCLPLVGDDKVLAGALHDAGGDRLLARLPLGWDTVLSREFTDGADFSGGEWQRVALARALAAVRGGAGLLILDEPTASLDVRAETELFERFLALTRDVTTILVSHRLSSVRRADRIVVIDEGCIVEDGTHDELMRRGGRYAEMFLLQAQRFSEASVAVSQETEDIAHA